MLHLGDNPYEYRNGSCVIGGGNTRDHERPETASLARCRQRHVQYKAEAYLQAAHAIAPLLVVWEDHVVDINWADEIPGNTDIGHFRHYAESIDAPVRTGADVTRIAPAEGGGFNVATTQGSWRARNVVLATGGYQTPKIPALSAQLPSHILQLHTDSYRNPGQLPDGAVLIVGTGQSGGQIAEELLAVGREIHLAVSTCPEAPRRYRGQDLLYWMMQLAQFGPDYGLNGLTVGQLPSPAARFACNPLVSGADGGHDIHLRDLGRRGVRLHGHLEAADDGDLVFSDDLPERLGLVEAAFYQRMKPMFDSYIAATGMSAPEPEPPRKDDWLPSEPARLNLEAANVTSVLWATGYRLDFSILDIPVLDEWNYPRHHRGVTEHPGLYAVGLPWLTGHGSSIVAGVGRDAEYIAQHIAGNIAAR